MKVAVIGAGPGGSTTAAILARHGVQVHLFERERFPRHHVGESLQPACFALLDLHLGLGERIRSMGMQRKYGALYRWGEDDAIWSVLFDPRLDDDLPGLTRESLASADYEHAWHVDRASFDTMLLQVALEHGAQLHPTTVRRVCFDGERATGVVDEHGVTLDVDHVIDASGQTALVARQLGLVQPLEDLRAVASYGYLDGDAALPGALGREATLIVSRPEGWMWWIPVGASRTSLGFVTHDAAALPRGDEGRVRLVALAREAGLPVPPDATPDAIGPLRTTRDWSYRTTSRNGPGWTAVGDAAGFVDPILSGGVDFAVRDACNTALALLRARDEPSESARILAAAAARATEELDAYVRLARYWYGNNRSVSGFFWEARRAIASSSDFVETPLRAFVYLTSGRYSADRHFKVFIAWQEQRIFRQLGVDRPALSQALAAVRGRRGSKGGGSR